MQTKIFKDFCPTKQTRIIAKKKNNLQTTKKHQKITKKITKKSAAILVCLVGQKSLKVVFCILGETLTS